MLGLHLILVLLFVRQSCPTLCDYMVCSLCPWNSPGKNTGMSNFLFSRGSSQPRDPTGSPALQADTLPSESPGKLLLFFLGEKKITFCLVFRDKVFFLFLSFCLAFFFYFSFSLLVYQNNILELWWIFSVMWRHSIKFLLFI